jgi:hypothetical protein
MPGLGPSLSGLAQLTRAELVILFGFVLRLEVKNDWNCLYDQHLRCQNWAWMRSKQVLRWARSF